jgi:hypothetical protein
MFDSDSARYGVYYSVAVPRFLETGMPDRPFYHVVSAYLQFVDDHRERVKYIYPRRSRNYEQLVKSGYKRKLEKVGNPQDPPVRPRMTAWWDLYANLTYNFSVNRC